MSTGRSVTTAELGGVTIGANTLYPLTAEPSGFDTSMRAPVIESPFSDGSRYLGASRVNALQVTFEVRVKADSQAEIVDRLAALKAAWGPVRSGVQALTFSLADEDLVLFGRPSMAAVDYSDKRFGTARARLVFEATDPRMFSAVESSIVLGLTVGGGVMAPVTAPVTAGAGSDSDGTAVNAGTFETDWVAEIVGPVTTPRLTLGSTGQYVELDGDIPDGSTLVVSSMDGSVLLNGSPRPGWPTLTSRFWKLPAGSNTVRFRAASGTGTVTFAWRDAKL